LVIVVRISRWRRIEDEVPVDQPSGKVLGDARSHIGSYWMSRHSRTDVTPYRQAGSRLRLGRFWHRPPRLKSSRSPRFSSRTRFRSPFSREKDGKLRAVYPGRDHRKVVEPSKVLELWAN